MVEKNYQTIEPNIEMREIVQLNVTDNRVEKLRDSSKVSKTTF